MLNHSRLSRSFAAYFAIVFILSCASTNLAQSGRRVRKSTSPPVTNPEPTPEPTPTTSSQTPKPRLTFLVGLNRYTGFVNIPFYAYEGVLRSVAERLADAPSVHVGGAQSEMNRSEAIQKAKAEKEAYVVFLELRVDSMTGDSRNGGTNDDLSIEYWVFAPTTAKVATSGGTYTRSQRSRVLIPGRTSSVYGDRYLNQAAQEAADRILAHFRLHAPPNRRPWVRGQRSEVRGQKSEVRD